MNNKGNFKNDGSFGKRILGFFKESGFYIAIVVGLCALAAGAVFFSTNQILTDPEQNNAQENDIADNGDQFGIIDYTEDIPKDIQSDESSINDSNGTEFSDEGPNTGLTADENAEVDDSTIIEGNSGTTAESAQADKTAQNDADGSQSTSGNATVAEEDAAPAEAVVLAIVKPAFKAPLVGKIQSAHSMDKLVFSPTFNEWRTHSGVDISAPRGEVVRSIGNGVIHEIKNDPRFGFTIVIDHKNGYKSLYANLASDLTMTVGKEIKLGDPIGSVGATAIFESAEPTHIHFELFKEDKIVDPAAYIEFAK